MSRCASNFSDSFAEAGCCRWLRGLTKIMERHEGKPIAHLKVNEGLKALRDAVEEFGPTHNFTKLVPGLDGSDPGPHTGPALLLTLACLRCAVGIVWSVASA